MCGSSSGSRRRAVIVVIGGNSCKSYEKSVLEVAGVG